MVPEKSVLETPTQMGEASHRWCLLGRLTETGAIQAIAIDSSPFRIGRRPDLCLTLPRPAVSGLHAEIILELDCLMIRDLGSTNGTYVNGVRVTDEIPLQEGDVITLADVSFRFNQRQDADRIPCKVDHASPIDTSMSFGATMSESEFNKFLQMRTVTPHFQPIVSLRDNKIMGYEVLARSRAAGLQTPTDMFAAAAELGLEEELSRMLRFAGFAKAMMMGDTGGLFMNTHPAEIESLSLLESLPKLRDLKGDKPLTLEIREPLTDDIDVVRKLRGILSSLGMRLAYDHFGSGQSRRGNLGAVLPDYVKFDMNLIRDIHLAPSQQRTLLANLVKMVRDLGIVPVAMGIECEFEHAACCDIGFELGQGYFYGEPTPEK